MIIKEGSNKFRIVVIGDSKEIVLTRKELEARLTDSQVWEPTALLNLLDEEVGYSTPKVFSKYS